MKILTLEIEKCYLCPGLGSLDSSKDFFCMIARRTVEASKINSIQEWCPLPDKKQEDISQ